MAEGMQQLGCSGLDDLLKMVEEKKGIQKIYILCSGAVNETGESWCPDCVKAEPVVERGLKKVKDPENTIFIMCSVGDRPTWKDPNNAFRKHEKFKLQGIPTLLCWGDSKRLGPDDCSKQDLVDMFFEED